jgi:hypothetical protein
MSFAYITSMAIRSRCGWNETVKAGLSVLYGESREADRRGKLIRVPRNLDFTPYRDEKDFGLLQRLVSKEKQNFS